MCFCLGSLRFAQEKDRAYWDNELVRPEEANVIVSAVTERIIGKSSKPGASAKFEEKLQEQNAAYMKKLKRNIEADKKKLEMAMEEVEAQHKSFNVFLQDQGNTT